MRSFRHRVDRQRAFTLIELLIVILIIGILLAVALPSFLGQTTKAEDSVATQNLYNTYEAGKIASWNPTGTYPTVGDPAVDLPALISDLQTANPGFTYSDGPSPTNPDQVGIVEINPETVEYADTSASGTTFCLTDVETPDYGGNGVPAGLTLDSGTGDFPCGDSPAPPTVQITSPTHTPVQSFDTGGGTTADVTANYTESGDVADGTTCTLTDTSDSAITTPTCPSGDGADSVDLGQLNVGTYKLEVQDSGDGGSGMDTVSFTVLNSSCLSNCTSIDPLPPTVVITAPSPDGSFRTTNSTVNVTYVESGDVSGGTLCTLAKNGGTPSPVSCSSGDSSLASPDNALLSGLTAGNYNFTVTDTGAAGGTADSGENSVGFIVLPSTPSPKPKSPFSFPQRPAPDVEDLVLNEVNTGEAAVPGDAAQFDGPLPNGDYTVQAGGDIRLTADIDDHNLASTYDFLISHSANILTSEHALAQQYPNPPAHMDTHDGVLDYHQDVPVSDLSPGVYYWLVSATVTNYSNNTTSVEASFRLTANGDGTFTISDVQNIGLNGVPLGNLGDGDGGGESIASNGGVGGGGACGSWSNNNSYSTGNCVVYGGQDYQATENIPAGSGEAAPSTPPSHTFFASFACSGVCTWNALDIGPGSYSGAMTQGGWQTGSYADWYYIAGTPGTVVTGSIIDSHAFSWQNYDDSSEQNGLPCSYRATGSSSCTYALSPSGSSALSFTIDETGIQYLEVGANTASNYTLRISGSGISSVTPQWEPVSAGEIGGGGGGSVPSNTTAPTAPAGSTTVGNTLTADSGAWGGGVTGYSYKWQDCNNVGASCSDIGGATSSTYTLQSSDAGHTIIAEVAATNTTGTSAYLASPASATVTCAAWNSGSSYSSGDCVNVSGQDYQATENISSGGVAPGTTTTTTTGSLFSSWSTYGEYATATIVDSGATYSGTMSWGNRGCDDVYCTEDWYYVAAPSGTIISANISPATLWNAWDPATGSSNWWGDPGVGSDWLGGTGSQQNDSGRVTSLSFTMPASGHAWVDIGRSGSAYPYTVTFTGSGIAGSTPQWQPVG